VNLSIANHLNKSLFVFIIIHCRQLRERQKAILEALCPIDISPEKLDHLQCRIASSIQECIGRLDNVEVDELTVILAIMADTEKRLIYYEVDDGDSDRGRLNLIHGPPYFASQFGTEILHAFLKKALEECYVFTGKVQTQVSISHVTYFKMK